MAIGTSPNKNGMGIPAVVKSARTFVRNAGWQHYCPVCERHTRRFAPHGFSQRPNARCPYCGTVERHRLDWMFFRRHTDLYDGRPKRLLHIAPEVPIERMFRRVPGVTYLSGDLNSPVAMEKMDITDIRHPDESFDVIYCSHVLEHVPDDRKAISEFFRVLAPGGWALLQVPVLADKTAEDLSITDPDERMRHYGHPGHVRVCGRDYADRMRDAGFAMTVLQTNDILSAAETRKMAVPEDCFVFFARRPA